jgi:predicted DNA-binding protein (UPF0251 family)
MADAYRAKADVSIPRPVAKLSGEGDEAVYATEGVNYPAGSHILASNMEPHVRKRAEAGELDHLLEPASLEDAQNAPVGEPEFAVFVPEHEAEAHVLEQYGHTIVPQEQELEVLSLGAERAAEYQQAVKDAGLDRRPAQEVMQAERERVPDEVLEGHETRTGLPSNREPVIQYEPEGDPAERVHTDPTAPAPRPRPGEAVSPQEGEASGEGSQE